MESHLKAMIAGATLMYVLDPDRGARRRGMLRDRLLHANRKLEDGLDAAARDARNRSKGLAARVGRRLRSNGAPDAVIEERVRSQLGRVVSHPRSIEVSARGGRVTLSGLVLGHELEPLLSRVRKVRGVEDVVSRLEAHENAGNVPGLQGAGRRRRPRSELMQENWTPALRLLTGTLGAAALLRGWRGSGVTGVASTALGSALLARSWTNLPTRRLVGVNAGREAVSFRKAVNVAAPIEDVWDLWSRFDNFPRFMEHLEEVRITGDGRSHWTARGPAGTRVQWEAEVTAWKPAEEIAWKSVEGATVASAGRVRFQPTDGGTHVEVQLSYNPPAGAMGHVVAALFGSDPKRAMDEDLLRLKSLLEQGKATAHGQAVTQGALQ